MAKLSKKRKAMAEKLDSAKTYSVEEAIRSNLEALLVDLKRAKPATSKGVYIKKVVLSSTMGPGVQIDHSALAQ